MSIQRHVTLALVLWGTLGFANTASAQRGFLDIPGIDGESVLEGYVGWIDVLSIRQNAATTTRKSIACDLSVVKRIDVAGPALWATAASGQILPEMTIVVLRDRVEGDVLKLYDIRLANVRISGVQATTGATDSSETITLLPQGVTLTYYPQLPTGVQGTPVSQSFSCQ